MGWSPDPTDTPLDLQTAPMWDLDQTPGFFVLAQPWLLLPFGEGTHKWKIFLFVLPFKNRTTEAGGGWHTCTP